MFNKMYVYALFGVLTMSNFIINPPVSAHACSCPDGCVGSCCNGTPCACYDIGTDNCKAAPLEEGAS